MIGLIALAIAFLTLLTPSPSPERGPWQGTDSSADTATPAGPTAGPKAGPKADPAAGTTAGSPPGGPGVASGLLGAWSVDVRFPDEKVAGAPVKETELHIVEVASEDDPAEDQLAIEFGPEGERWRGLVDASADGDAEVFSSRARCRAYADSVATITGRLADGELTGVILLGEEDPMLTYRAKRLGA